VGSRQNAPCAVGQEGRFRPVQSGLNPRNQGTDLEAVGCFLLEVIVVTCSIYSYIH